MKRAVQTVFLVLILTLPLTAVSAHEDHDAKPGAGHATGHAAKPAADHAPGKAVELKGEVLDLACFIAHDGKGPDHTGCARMCAKQGQPTGLLADDGKVYVIFSSHDNPSVLDKVKTLAGKRVAVKGEVFTRSGVTGFEIAEISAL